MRNCDRDTLVCPFAMDADAEIKKLREQLVKYEAALREISKDSYLDEWEMEYRPTAPARKAKAALTDDHGATR